MTDIVDAEVVLEHRLDWCLRHNPDSPCPGYVKGWLHQDPANPRRTYRLPDIRCTCACHTRPVLSGTESKPTRK